MCVCKCGCTRATACAWMSNSDVSASLVVLPLCAPGHLGLELPRSRPSYVSSLHKQLRATLKALTLLPAPQCCNGRYALPLPVKKHLGGFVIKYETCKKYDCTNFLKSPINTKNTHIDDPDFLTGSFQWLPGTPASLEPAAAADPARSAPPRGQSCQLQ